MELLRLNRKCWDRKGIKKIKDDGVEGLIEEKISEIIKKDKWRIDIGDKIEMYVKRKKIDWKISLGGRNIRKVGMVWVLMMERIKSLERLKKNIIIKWKKFWKEIRIMKLINERLVLSGNIVKVN